MKYNLAPVLQNKFVLYAFLAMTLIRIVFFVNSGDMASVITIGLVGFITSFFSKNMIIILCVALTVSSLLTYGIKSNTHEGLENKDDTNNSDETMEEEKKDGKSEEKKDGKSEEKKDGKSEEKKNDTETANKNGETNSVETSDKTKDEMKEQYDNLKKEYPEFKEVQEEIMKGIERMDPLLQKAETFINKYSNYKQ